MENLIPGSEYRARNNERTADEFLYLLVTDGDRPKAPDGLRVVWNYGNRVNITWNAVESSMDGGTIRGVVQYTLYYVEAEKTGQWTTVGYPMVDWSIGEWMLQTNNTWVIMNDLQRDALYSLYVIATINGKTSRSSSVVTVLAQPGTVFDPFSDLLGLPEPVITITPDHLDGVYLQNDKISINCSVPADVLKGHLNLDLTAGSHTVRI
ncbi:unnamed protein product [Strongylus vulgaris]|uniref:Fibronectin type-III domain-containing protein n=1 Tax=Strongylus vulgaris TaxID=40348 RepID=A0A3P7ILL6_STRVU|nr:unnamed protein product [Strongylus vulgaris]